MANELYSLPFTQFFQHKLLRIKTGGGGGVAKLKTSPPSVPPLSTSGFQFEVRLTSYCCPWDLEASIYFYLFFLILIDFLHIALSESNVFCRASRRAFQHVIDSDTGASEIAQYWLLLLHLKKNDLPAAMVCNDLKSYTCLRDFCWKHSRHSPLLGR